MISLLVARNKKKQQQQTYVENITCVLVKAIYKFVDMIVLIYIYPKKGFTFKSQTTNTRLYSHHPNTETLNRMQLALKVWLS